MSEPQRIPGPERRPAGGQLIQHRAQRVQIGPLIHRPGRPPGGLRRQVRQRPHDLGMVGEPGADLGQRRRQREIHQARAAAARDHDVRRGDVPVQHPRPVHPRHRPGQPLRQPGHLTGRQRPGHPGQGHAARVRQYDRPGILRRRSASCATPLTPRSRSSTAASCRTRRSASGPSGSLRMTVHSAEEQPGHARARALVHHLCPVRRIPARQYLACHHTHLHARPEPPHILLTPDCGRRRLFIGTRVSIATLSLRSVTNHRAVMRPMTGYI